MLSLKKHQVDALKLFEKSPRGILLHHGMGMGKTFVAGELMKNVDRPPLVLWKSSTRTQFQGECENRWGRHQEFYAVTVNSDPHKTILEHASKLNQTLEDFLEGRLVIIDEAHNFARLVVRAMSKKGDPKVVRLFRAFVQTKNIKFLLMTATPHSGAKDNFLGVCYCLLTGHLQNKLPVISPEGDKARILRSLVHHASEHPDMPQVDSWNIREGPLEILSDGINLIYASSKRGKESLSKYLSALYEEVCIKKCSGVYRTLPPTTSNERYVVLGASSSETDQKKQKALLEFMNSPENCRGSLCRIVVITDALVEGLNLKNVRRVHVLETGDSLVPIRCAIGRATRLHSHDDLSIHERRVSVYIYLGKDQKTTFENALVLDKEQERNLKECLYDNF